MHAHDVGSFSSTGSAFTGCSASVSELACPPDPTGPHLLSLCAGWWRFELLKPIRPLRRHSDRLGLH